MLAYTYRGDGNIASERDHNNVTTTYTYDLLGRLISEVGGYSRYYTYDAAGNRTQAIVDTSTTISYTYDSDGRLVSEISSNGSSLLTTSYAYDSNGSLISENDGDVTNYGYDVWGNMTSAGGATYAYNAQGLRVSKTISGVTDSFVLVGGDVWADSESTYLRGLELISSDDYFYLYNIRGDVIQLLDYDGEVVKTYDYDAYGNELSRDLADENPFRYCGEYYDTETGLIYLRARYYDPSIGRFTSVDPIKDGLNWYAYCDGNPVIFEDSDGLVYEVVFDLISAWFSINDFVNSPSLTNFGYLVWDVASIFCPFVPGSYAAKVFNYLSDGAKVVNQADNFTRIGAEVAEGVGESIKKNVWSLSPLKRGWAIEKMLGGMCNNFPIIDKFVKSHFDDGVQYLSSITSIKSMDTTAQTYQNASKMYNQLVKYIDALTGFNTVKYQHVVYGVDENTKRILELALPTAELTEDQARIIEDILKYAQDNHVELIIHRVE